MNDSQYKPTEEESAGGQIVLTPDKKRVVGQIIITDNFSERRRVCFEATFAFVEWNKMPLKSHSVMADQTGEKGYLTYSCNWSVQQN